MKRKLRIAKENIELSWRGMVRLFRTRDLVETLEWMDHQQRLRGR